MLSDPWFWHRYWLDLWRSWLPALPPPVMRDGNVIYCSFARRG
jgi:hypothetical protein